MHDEEELRIGLKLKPDLLGVNNRDLRDLSIDLRTSQQLSKLIPNEQVAISESGIETYEDLMMLSKCGYRGFLVGSSLMTTGQPGKALSKLIRGIGNED